MTMKVRKAMSISDCFWFFFLFPPFFQLLQTPTTQAWVWGWPWRIQQLWKDRESEGTAVVRCMGEGQRIKYKMKTILEKWGKKKKTVKPTDENNP